MRALRTLASATVLVAGLAAFPAPAMAATTYEFAVSGVEVSATSTRGVFVGAASGAAIGTWTASVYHGELGRQAPITGGSFRMYLTTAAPAYTVSGKFSSKGGTIAERWPYGANCTNQVYDVDGTLKNVTPTRTGSFNVDLTHYRKRVFGRCWTYAATVVGKVTLGAS